MGDGAENGDRLDMHTETTHSKRTRPGYAPGDFGAPMLLLVSVAAVGVSVAAILVVGITGAGWTVAMALIAALTATAAVLAVIAKMLGEADQAGS
jgi:uncharacterized membrane protein